MPSDHLQPGEANQSAPRRQAASSRRGRGQADDPASAGLRKLWQDIEHEPVPAEFFDLLDAIDAARAEKGSGSDADPGKTP